MAPYIVTINGSHKVRVFAWDAVSAAQRGSTVYQFTNSTPEPIAHIAAEADMRIANGWNSIGTDHDLTVR